MRLLTGSLGLSLTCLTLLPLSASAHRAPLPAKIDFNRDVRPILSNNCFQCHGPDEKTRKAKLRLDTKDGAHAASVVAGKPDSSELIVRLTATADDASVMPPLKTGKKITPREVDLLKQWVKEGANYSTHWAYVKPVRPEVPENQVRRA